jgi:hypothetical protein
MRTEDGFGVAGAVPEDMGAATRAVADDVGAVGAVRALEMAAAALPGSAFARAADRVIADWSAHGRAIADDLAAQAQALTAAGRTYGWAETTALHTLRNAEEA